MAKKGSSKVTSNKVARKASAALRDGRSSARTRSIAGSALSQATGKSKRATSGVCGGVSTAPATTAPGIGGSRKAAGLLEPFRDHRARMTVELHA
jgi:hypothetical protein